VLLVHEVGISPLAKDNLDRTPVILELLLGYSQEVVCLGKIRSEYN